MILSDYLICDKQTYLKNNYFPPGTEDPSYRTHHADDEHYEYDDNVDELFNLADHLISISHSRTKSIREVTC